MLPMIRCTAYQNNRCACGKTCYSPLPSEQPDFSGDLLGDLRRCTKAQPWIHTVRNILITPEAELSEEHEVALHVLLAVLAPVTGRNPPTRWRQIGRGVRST